MKTANVVRGFASALIVLGALALQGCAMYPKYSETVYFADYRPYTAEGFTISPSSSGFTYESIGDLEMVFIIGQLEDAANENGVEGLQTLREYEEQREMYSPSYAEMTEKIVREAQKLGADALLNFRIRPLYSDPQTRFGLVGFTVSGFAVKLTK